MTIKKHLILRYCDWLKCESRNFFRLHLEREFSLLIQFSVACKVLYFVNICIARFKVALGLYIELRLSEGVRFKEFILTEIKVRCKLCSYQSKRIRYLQIYTVEPAMHRHQCIQFNTSYDTNKSNVWGNLSFKTKFKDNAMYNSNEYRHY